METNGIFESTRQEKMQKTKTIGRKIVLGKEDSEFVVRLLTKRTGKRFCCKNGKYTLKTKH